MILARTCRGSVADRLDLVLLSLFVVFFSFCLVLLTYIDILHSTCTPTISVHCIHHLCISRSFTQRGGNTNYKKVEHPQTNHGDSLVSCDIGELTSYETMSYIQNLSNQRRDERPTMPLTETKDGMASSENQPMHSGQDIFFGQPPRKKC